MPRLFELRPFAPALGCLIATAVLTVCAHSAPADDHVRELQTQAISQGSAFWGHWGVEPDRYKGWTYHSNRLIPIYTFGIKLDAFKGAKSPYRDSARLEKLYGHVPEATLNPEAEYFDQTDVYCLQKMAFKAGKKHIILMVFDGTDWQTTQAAAIYRAGRIAYREGRGTGLHLQDYAGTTTDYGCFVSSPYADGYEMDVDNQKVHPGEKVLTGGYDPRQGGERPWLVGSEPEYLLGTAGSPMHAVTDSAASATSLTAGIKTYNDSVNVDPQGRQAEPISHWLQREQKFAIGVVTTVPISHATPACAYGQNVTREDYQDLTRDMLGLPSISHPSEPLPGVDVLIGSGWGEEAAQDPKQGANYVPGNKYLTAKDQKTVDLEHGGRYRVAARQAGKNGGQVIMGAAREAAERNERLLGFFGVASTGHLPFQTADGKYDTTAGALGVAEKYTQADIDENPTLAEMTTAALTVLERSPRGFWLMIEAGDVDWANHDDNIDNSIGAVLSGDEAFRAVTDWVEKHNAWDDTAVIVTADHGHHLVLLRPDVLLPPAPSAGGQGR